MILCVILPYMIKPEASYYFIANDIKQPGSLVKRISMQADPVSKYLNIKVGHWLRNTTSLQLKENLLQALNEMLADEDFFHQKRFLSSFGAQKQKLFLKLQHHRPVGYLNRMLLQETYPQYLRRLADYWLHSPTLHSFFIFGTYKQDNLLYLVTMASWRTLYISFSALILSLFFGIFLIFLHFYSMTGWAIQFLLAARLFLLIMLAALFRLDETSNLKIGVDWYLILFLGFSGALFLAAQSTEDVKRLKKSLFVAFAQSLGENSFIIFLHHVFRNCTTFPISVVKQMRDNILFLSILTFLGVVQLQPYDLGGLICQLYNSPEIFYQGWWILFFPCAFLSGLVLLFDLAGERLAEVMSIFKFFRM